MWQRRVGRSNWLGVVGQAALVLAVLLGRAGTAGAGGLTFAEVAARDFPRWDLDHDGWLTAGEVDRLLKDPTITGDDAAALATVKFRDRGLPAAQRAGYTAGLYGLSRRAAPDPRSPGRPYVYEAQFLRFREMLAGAPDRIFARTEPDFGALRQGPIGDCFFFSVTGALAARHPGRVVSMIRPESDGSWSVRFPRETVRVPRLTDAEALVNNTASTLRDGYWVVVLELAVGEVFRARERAGLRTPDPADAIAFGGSSRRVIEVYTGHRAGTVPLRVDRGVGPHIIDFDAGDADSAPEVIELGTARVGPGPEVIDFGTSRARPGGFRDSYMESPGEAERLTRVRRILQEVIGAGRLAAVSMGRPPAGRRKVPGFVYGHAYGVLGYDRGDDHVTLWNPWGDTFTPKGPPGLENGFPTEHGVFRLPLRTACEQFSTLNYETGDAVGGLSQGDPAGPPSPGGGGRPWGPGLDEPPPVIRPPLD
jgi:hypothetical protein